MEMNKNLAPKEIFKNMTEELTAVNKGLEEENLSKKDLSEIKNELEKVELQAYKTKFSIKLNSLSLEEPNLSLKDLLVRMLDLLPSDINPSFLPILTDYIFKKWKPSSQDLAA